MSDARPLRRGLFLAAFDELSDPNVLVDLAVAAEAGGWDGVFLWDHVVYRPPIRAVADPWVALSVIAAHTDRVRLGPTVTPLLRRRVQKEARETVALDRLSRGRLTLGVGLGSSNTRLCAKGSCWSDSTGSDQRRMRPCSSGRTPGRLHDGDPAHHHHIAARGAKQSRWRHRQRGCALLLSGHMRSRTVPVSPCPREWAVSGCRRTTRESHRFAEERGEVRRCRGVTI